MNKRLWKGSNDFIYPGVRYIDLSKFISENNFSILNNGR